MEFCFEGDGVVGEEEGVGVVEEGDGGVSEFSDAVGGFEPPGESDFDQAWAERADVGDDVDVAGTDVGDAVVVVGDGGVEPASLRANSEAPASSPQAWSAVSALA